MNHAKLVIHTDIFLQYLTQGHRGGSILRNVMERFFCYTTVFNAIELFSLARTGSELEAITRSMSAVKILGLNARSARHYGRLLARQPGVPRMNLLIAGLCMESKLPALTHYPEEFQMIRGLRIISPADIGVET